MLMISIKSMKSSEDIQEGIYLDVMSKTEKKPIERYSLKSKISEVLHTKFGTMQQVRERNQKNRVDFQMDWSTFKELNWKQIMGILMVKDKNCLKTKKLLLLQ